jgi:hypothetical protein
MEFPSIFLFSSKINSTLADSLEVAIYDQVSVAFDKQVKDKLLIFETNNQILLAHVNEAFKKKIQSNLNIIENLNANHILLKSHFSWGFFLVIDKKNNDFILCNDPYGIYPLYYYYSMGNFIISNDLDSIINMLDQISLDDLGLYDYFLFNYTLKSRTILKEISQVGGDTFLEYKNNILRITRRNDLIASLFSNRTPSNIGKMADTLKSHLHLNYDPNIPTTFPLTGGFDSKVILSLLLSERINFNAVTFGKKDSDDFIAASSISGQYNFKHIFLGMNQDFLNSIDLKINEFLRCSPNAPMLDTLLYYQLTKEKIQSSNLVTGMMGGEMIVGPVLISELITTRSSALLTHCKSRKELLSGLERNIKEQGIFNIDLFTKRSNLYIEPLCDYLIDHQKVQNENLIKFLLNETYAKFFGVVFSNLFSKCNIINPLVDIEFLRILFNSEYSFTSKKAFSKAPLSHYKSRRLYPELIKQIFPTVLKTKMDRGYYLEDFLKWYKFFRPFTNYFKRHFLAKEKKIYGDSSNYLSILESMAIEYVGNSEIIDWDIFDKNAVLKIIQDVKKKKNTSFQRQKLLQLLTVYFFVKRYGKRLNVSI